MRKKGRQKERSLGNVTTRKRGEEKEKDRKKERKKKDRTTEKEYRIKRRSEKAKES